MNDKYSDIKHYYEEWWENPKDPRDIIFRGLNKIVFERLPKGNNKKALDIGSGKGTIVSFLSQKGYKVTAIELNENFVEKLKIKFPEAEVIGGDFNSIPINGNFDIVTAIEFIQNLDIESLSKFLKKIATLTNHLLINISNRNSIHGSWTAVRGFQKPFVYTYTPAEFEDMLKRNGFRVTYKRGIGFITPITLLSEFRFKIIPIWVARTLNTVGDLLFPKICHLYYLEAKIFKED